MTTYYIFVIAHPDDESMFFVPTIRALIDERRRRKHRHGHGGNENSNYVVWIVCLTTGNYDGLGVVRRDELNTVANGTHTILGCDKVVFLSNDENEYENDDQLRLPQDHPTKRWDKEYVSSKIEETVIQHVKKHVEEEEEESEKYEQQQEEDIQEESHRRRRVVLITFDEWGVSGHVNHRDTYYSVFNRIMKQMIVGPSKVSIEVQKSSLSYSTAFTRRTTDEIELHIEGWQLYSEQNILKKYVPIYDWIMFVSYWLYQLLLLFIGGSSSSSSMDEMNTTLNESSLSCLLVDGDESSRTTGCSSITFRNVKPWINWYAMKTHASQFVWYRRLFVIFSCYTYCNQLQPMIKRQNNSTTSTTKRSNSSNNDDDTTNNKQTKKEE